MKLQEVSALVGGTLIGSGHRDIHGVQGLEAAGPDDLSFIDDARLGDRARTSHAGAILVPVGVHIDGIDCVQVRKPKLAWAQVLGHLHPEVAPGAGVHPTAVVSPTAHISPDASVGPFCVLGEGCSIGAGSRLVGHVCIGAGAVVGNHVMLAPHVVVAAGARIGDHTRVHSWTALGDVVLASHVEIGARCSLASGTQVDEGTKIDNMVTLGRDVKVGSHTIIVSYSHFADRCRIGSHSLLAGQVWVQENVSVGDRCIVAGRARVTRDVPSRSFISGDDNRPHKDELRLFAYMQQLPQALRSLGQTGA